MYVLVWYKATICRIFMPQKFQVSQVTLQNGIILSQPLILQGIQSRNDDDYSHEVFAIPYDRKFEINEWLGDDRI